MLPEDLACGYRFAWTDTHQGMHWCQWLHVGPSGCWWWCRYRRAKPRELPVEIYTVPWWRHHSGAGKHLLHYLSVKNANKSEQRAFAKTQHCGLTRKNYNFYRTPTYRCEVRGRLWLGHIVAIEENRFSVCKGIKKANKLMQKIQTLSAASRLTKSESVKVLVHSKPLDSSRELWFRWEIQGFRTVRQRGREWDSEEEEEEKHKSSAKRMLRFMTSHSNGSREIH